MNANMRHILKRTILALVCGAGFLLLSAANASAHELKYRPYYVKNHYVHSRSKFFPAWLRRNREFQRWYVHNSYRFARRISWHRLYDIYHMEKRHRWHGRRIYDKHYRNYDYRPYYVLPKKHRH